MLIGHTTFPFFKYILKNKGDKNMKIRDNKFLTSDELSYIVNGVANATDEFSKEILKVALTAQIVVEDVDWSKYDTCNDIYDYMMQEFSKYDYKVEENEREGVEDFCISIYNYGAIDTILERENSVEKTVERFLNGLNDKIDEYSKTVDITQLEGLLGELKKLGDGDGIENEEVLKEIKEGQ